MCAVVVAFVFFLVFVGRSIPACATFTKKTGFVAESGSTSFSRATSFVGVDTRGFSRINVPAIAVVEYEPGVLMRRYIFATGLAA